jgi:RIO kinase 1
LHRIDPDDWEHEDTNVPIRRGRVRLHARRSTTDLHIEKGSATSSAHRYTDPDLQTLFERGALREVLLEIKSGKEATVYLVQGQQGPLVAKVYADQGARAFQDDGVYHQGQFIKDQRVRRAVTQRSDFGNRVRQAQWVTREYRALWELHRAGLPVPKPALGHEPTEYGAAGSVVLMEYFGDDEGPAPRISDLRLGREDAEEAWQQSVELLQRLARLGRVHGDYSTYNLLWHRGRVVVIDVPQMVSAAANPQAPTLLRRDIESLCQTFARQGVRRDPADLWRQVAPELAR